MIAFFDTSVHVDVLRGQLRLADVLARIHGGPVRLSPVVASELLRGASGKAVRTVERLVSSLTPIEPPSWRNAWLETGRLLPSAFRNHEGLGLARLQNDVLLALTARHTGAVLVSKDRHFKELQRHVRFAALVLP
ncbi:MAG: type II toxin-antitoxin system VapC family toxin [Polyangiales bacterium]